MQTLPSSWTVPCRQLLCLPGCLPSPHVSPPPSAPLQSVVDALESLLGLNMSLTRPVLEAWAAMQLGAQGPAGQVRNRTGLDLVKGLMLCNCMEICIRILVAAC